MDSTLSKKNHNKKNTLKIKIEDKEIQIEKNWNI